MFIQSTQTTDFSPLCLGIPLNLTDAVMMKQQQAMVTACFVCYNFDTASAVRYIGGQHTTVHQDVQAIITELRLAGLEDQLVNDLERIFTYGAPGF
jgi:hypothetical protein